MATDLSGEIIRKSQERPTNLTVWQWGLTLGQATGTTINLATKSIKRMSRPSDDGISFYEYIAYQGMRDYQSQLGPVGIQNLVRSTAKTCKQFAKRHGLPFSTINLPDGTVAHRLGALNCRRSVVFFHGGGYMAPALGQHINFAFGFNPSAHSDLAVYVLQYSLVTETANPYPCQLQQAAALLNHLLRTESISPLSTILLGDSAGGHLLLGLALHLRNPHPQVPPVKVDGRFAGAALISPWTTLYDEPEHSSSDYTALDILEPSALNRWAKSFLAGAPPDPWNAPLTADASWWQDLPIDNILVIYGRDEYLANDGKQIAETLQAHHEKDCESEKVYRAWLDSIPKDI
ncbi:hypothetical protein VHEMI05238 [[Torrubiella] hemipterigena]|uniref:Alpha/beta hydrolase fold-3 domain-containing protein n=1 Tax=[Torrubiella] hemipterigena TaxID=1531966 RepID=A0A0A1T3H6_9HYPO|nr:hypothetical protein VHEMI05238 [[Torrubiella] hemipterigena]